MSGLIVWRVAQMRRGEGQTSIGVCAPLRVGDGRGGGLGGLCSSVSHSWWKGGQRGV